MKVDARTIQVAVRLKTGEKKHYRSKLFKKRDVVVDAVQSHLDNKRFATKLIDKRLQSTLVNMYLLSKEFTVSFEYNERQEALCAFIQIRFLKQSTSHVHLIKEYLTAFFSRAQNRAELAEVIQKAEAKRVKKVIDIKKEVISAVESEQESVTNTVDAALT